MQRLSDFALVFAAVMVLSAMSIGKTVHYGYDGYFCTSTGYLAFDDLQNNLEAGHVVRSAHLLKIVRFGPGNRIYFAGEVDLPPTLAIRWMNCNVERVEVVGPVDDYKPLTKCVIRVSVPAKAECSDEVEHVPPRRDIPSLKVLAEDAPPPITLESPDDPDHRYQLLRHLTRRARAGGLEWNSKAEVIQLDQNGAILKRFVIYEDQRVEIAD